NVIDFFYCFFFQAEDGIRDFHVTGVQTCALPILSAETRRTRRTGACGTGPGDGKLSEELTGSPCVMTRWLAGNLSRIQPTIEPRSEERRVGKECRYRGWQSN